MEVDKNILLKLIKAIDERDYPNQRRLATLVETLIIKSEQPKKEDDGKP